MRTFVIMHEHRDPISDAPLFWNNDDGWTELSGATIFVENERTTFSLPQEAWGWLELPDQLWDLIYAYQYEADARAAALEDEDVF